MRVCWGSVCVWGGGGGGCVWAGGGGEGEASACVCECWGERKGVCGVGGGGGFINVFLIKRSSTAQKARS